MSLIQFLLAAFFLFALTRVISRYWASDISVLALVFWVLFWVAGIVITLLPDTTFSIARLLGVGRGADVVVYISIALMFFMLFRAYVKMRSMERDITTLTRALALAQDAAKNLQK